MKTFAWMTMALTVVACTSVRATAQPGPEWDMFLTGGYTNSRLTGGSDRLLGQDPRHGGTGGVEFQLRLGDTYAVDAGLRYARLGGGGIIDSTYAVTNLKDVTEAVGEADVVLDYVTIPLLFSFVADATEASYFRAYLGPSVNVLLRARATGTVLGKPIDQDIKSSLQNIVVSGVVGASYVYELKTWRLMADARYSEGFSRVANAGDMRIRAFSASLGVGIPLAR